MTASVDGTSVPNRPPSRGFRWYRLYYLLVAFDLFTVCLSLGVTHWLRTTYAEAVRDNREWGERLTAYSNLGSLAAEVNAPGNDVFISADPSHERARRDDAYARFTAAVDAQREAFGRRGLRKADIATLSKGLDVVERDMATMSRAADRIFVDFEKDPALAGRSMATMDQTYAQLLESFTALRQSVGEIQTRLFAEQASTASRVMYVEYAIATLAITMVTVASIYGHKMTRRVEKALDAQREAEVLAAERSALQLHQRELTHLANHDTLSSLPNRRLFMHRLNEMLVDDERHGETVAVLFIDVDNFKFVNDGIGHHAGDELITAIGERLRRSVRTTDTVARLGGDEFTILLGESAGHEAATRIANELMNRLAEPVTLGGQDLTITASIGIALGIVGSDNAEEMIRRADLAMYQAKHNGKGRWEMYTEDLSERASRRLRLENDLRRALDGEQIQLHYQPIVRLADRKVIGFEALLRWTHPSLGSVPVLEVIEIAEETDLIIPIGRRVLDEACRQGAQWRQTTGRDLFVSVNVSARQLINRDFVSTVQSALLGSGLPAGALHLEVTESLMMANPVEAARVLHELRELGAHVALDDFGTGYASLHQLTQLPLSVLKVDRSLVSGIETDDRSRLLFDSMVNLSIGLRMATVAEGIETEAEFELALASGCQHGQGYLFGRPSPASETTELLTDGRLLLLAVS